MNNTGEFLKSLRISKGLTQMDLAAYLNVSNKTISKWENGIGIPEVSTLVLLADYFDVSVDDILRGSKRVSKNPEKEATISEYLITRVKNLYINHLILSFGIWLLSNVTMIVLGETTSNSSLGLGAGLIIMTIGVIVQGININNVRMNVKELNLIDKQGLLSFVFNSSYIFLYVTCATFIFAGVYHVGNSDVLEFIFVINRGIYTYFLTAIRAIIIYHIIRLFKITVLTKMTTRNVVLNGILLLLLLVPFMIVSISDPYELSIKMNHSYVSYSSYDKDSQTDRYYELKYLFLLESQSNANDYLIYNDLTNEYTYTFDDDYELVMSYETYDFISGLRYVKFVFDDDTATGYMIEVSKSDMRIVLYNILSIPLVSLYAMGCGLYLVKIKEKKCPK